MSVRAFTRETPVFFGGRGEDQRKLTLELLLSNLGLATRVVEVVADTASSGEAKVERSSRFRHGGEVAGELV